MKKNYLFIFTIIVVLTATSLANSLSTKILLPDGNSAPFATVTIGDKVYRANEKGEVEITFGSEKKALLKWLDLEVEVPIEATMKIPNKVLVGPPYDELYWEINGPDTWDIDSNIIYSIGGKGNESQIYLDEDFDNYIIRSKFIARDPGQWYYMRFFMRSYDLGWNGYAISFATNPGERGDFYRYEGNWDKHTQVSDPLLVCDAVPEGIPIEVVGFLKGDHIVIYMRIEGETEYTILVDTVDNSDEAYYSGGISIYNSFCDIEVTEFAVFKY